MMINNNGDKFQCSVFRARLHFVILRDDDDDDDNNNNNNNDNDDDK